MAFPALIKAEVKLTTGRKISFSAREIEALKVENKNDAGVVAVLFVGGNREVDGRWVMVDAGAWRNRKADSISATRSVLVSFARTQLRLDELRRHVDGAWPAFLDGWIDVAAQGHENLLAELARAHRDGTLRARLPNHAILDLEHRASVRGLVDRHGASAAGRLAQDLLAYLIALAGYSAVTNNPVGVPDFVLSDFIENGGGATRSGNVVIEVTRDEAARLVELCRAAGENDLARTVSRIVSEWKR